MSRSPPSVRTAPTAMAPSSRLVATGSGWTIPRWSSCSAFARGALMPTWRDCYPIDWPSHGVVGFTSTFAQNVPSLAFARALKQHYKDRSWCRWSDMEGEMGVE